tara:strand:+ start:67 stop:312 length:246 start_codon:yes stop_codon:yes gene_type:complete
MTTTTNRGTHFMKLHECIPVDKLDWSMLSANPNAIHLMKQNLDQVNWKFLSSNPNAIPILEKNLDKVDWFGCLKIQMRFIS